MEITLYQTLEDRENPEKIEAEGPFLCRHKGAWLSEGYYFWDTHIELSHWWGETNYKQKGYVICRAYAILDETCWDLHGNGNHLLEFEKVCMEMINQGIAKSETLLVPNVIAFLRKTGKFPYKAVRALGVSSISPNQSIEGLVYRLKFVETNKTFLDLRPAIQLCLFEKRGMSLKDYFIVFPDNYVESAYA